MQLTIALTLLFIPGARSFSALSTPCRPSSPGIYRTNNIGKIATHFPTSLGFKDQTVVSVGITENHDHGKDYKLLLLPYQETSHNSVTIIIPEKNKNKSSHNIYRSFDCEDDYTSLESFRRRLDATILTCRRMEKSSLWIQVPMSKASIIETMTDIAGLEFHHAEGKVAHLRLWLKDNVECKIPEFATHQVGVGAIVINSRNEILCVRGIGRNWNIPGGLAELGEGLHEAVVREVLEETGIQTKFENVLGFRHSHGKQFDRSDLFFVCELELVLPEDDGGDGTLNIPEPVAEESEIAETAWFPLEDYMKIVAAHPFMEKVMQLRENNRRIRSRNISGIMPGKEPSPIYHII